MNYRLGADIDGMTSEQDGGIGDGDGGREVHGGFRAGLNSRKDRLAFAGHGGW